MYEERVTRLPNRYTTREIKRAVDNVLYSSRPVTVHIVDHVYDVRRCQAALGQRLVTGEFTTRAQLMDL